VSKRRRRDDSDHVDAAVPRKGVPAQRKRQKASLSTAESTSAEVEDSDSSPKPPVTRETSLTASTSSSAVPGSGNQLTFLHTSVPGDGSAEPRFPRSRATLPTPIPNLTKKSRGRRVPTQVSTTTDPDQKATRLYVCSVDGCGKCFHRGEHLKRHIRSIHTHEKRMCILSPTTCRIIDIFFQPSNVHFLCVKNILIDTTIYCNISRSTKTPPQKKVAPVSNRQHPKPRPVLHGPFLPAVRVIAATILTPPSANPTPL
jgi:uncharacterized Zn-finger protein